MLFRNIIFNALLVGLLTGVLLSVLQLAGVSPIIFAAEEFELADKPAPPTSIIKASTPVSVAENHGHDHGETLKSVSELVTPLATVTASLADEPHASHSHDLEAWAPADGSVRTFYTFASNILAAIGFAAIIMSLMTQTHLQGLAQLSPCNGLLWGAAGFIALFAIPALGLPPEIPGMEAAAIENRQGWWLLAVLAAVAGLACLAFAPMKAKALGLLVLGLPFLVGAPHPQGPSIIHPDPTAFATMTQLHSDFIVASAATNLVFWLALGLISAILLNRCLPTSPVDAA